MSRLWLTVLGLSGLAIGCASTPTPNLGSSSAAPETNSVVAASEPPIEVVTADELVVDFVASPEELQVVCKEMLQQASNNIVRRCMTRENWRTYDRAQEEWARRILRQMQGSGF